MPQNAMGLLFHPTLPPMEAEGPPVCVRAEQRRDLGGSIWNHEYFLRIRQMTHWPTWYHRSIAFDAIEV
jgi:hypothetical protein